MIITIIVIMMMMIIIILFAGVEIQYVYYGLNRKTTTIVRVLKLGYKALAGTCKLSLPINELLKDKK